MYKSIPVTENTAPQIVKFIQACCTDGIADMATEYVFSQKVSQPLRDDIILLM
jgi:hypothetical protein